MIYIGMAAMPSRLSNLELSVPILAKQCDRLLIVLNCDKTKTIDEPAPFIPDSIAALDNVTIKINNKNEGDREKFTGMHYIESGYYLSVDDDILYPEDYVESHIRHMQEFQAPCITCVHGSIFDPFNKQVAGFIHRRKMFHFTWKQDCTQKVLIPGTGTTCFQVDNFKMLPSEMPTTNMGDIWVAAKAAQKGLPIIAISRTENWLTPLPDGDMAISRNRPEEEMNSVMEANILHMQKMYRRL